MAEEYFRKQEENRERALEKVRDFPIAPGSYYPEMEEQTHLRDYLSVILRRKWILITFFVAVVTTVTIGTFMIKPLFRSTVIIKIEKDNPAMATYDQYAAAQNYEYYQTQFSLLKSRNLAKRVIRKMKLDSNPEFGGRKTEEKPGPFAKKTNPLAEDDIPSSLVNSFIGRVEVNPQKNSRLVDVSFVSYDPELATKIANTIASSFIELNLQSRFEATEQGREWLENQLELMKVKIEQAEEQLSVYASENEIVFLDYEDDPAAAKQNIITKKLSTLSKELTEATANRINKEVQYEVLYKEMNSGDYAVSPLVRDNELIKDLSGQLAKLESEYNQKLVTYKPEYPKMIELKVQIEEFRKRINSETKKFAMSIKKDYEAALKLEDYLKDAFEKQKQEALSLNNRSVQYQIFKREADTNRALYNSLLQKLKETGISATITASNIQIIDKAEVPKSPFKPDKKRNILMSILVGLLGGIGLAFLSEYLDNTIKTPEDIEKKVFMPSLGLVPLYNAKESASPVEYISHSDARSNISEAYSSIRTFLLFSTAGRPPKIMMITSPRREEGKTTTSINTAISLTKSNAKVIIVDADLRRPRLHKVFRVSNSSGLSSFLSGNKEFGDGLIKKTDIPDLDVLTSGPLPPNPAELLSSYRLRDLIDGLYPIYNFILFDTPPILGLADAAITSTLTDGVILVVRSGQTPKEATLQAKKILESVNAKVLGVVLNAINESNLKYGYYSYYEYYYQYGSNEDR